MIKILLKLAKGGRCHRLIDSFGSGLIVAELLTNTRNKFMGKYWNPVDPEKFGKMEEKDILEVGGRKLKWPSIDGWSIEGWSKFEDFKRQLQEGETIGLFLKRFHFNQVAEIPNDRKFQEFKSICIRGMVSYWSVWAMPKHLFKG
jgi:hypothetical protein